MSLHKWMALVFVWFASLTAVAVLAQGRQVPPPAQADKPLTPMIISGPDLGFRIEGRNGNTPVGKLVIRVDGQWVDTQFGGNPVPRRVTTP
jgi:hypothetical protein